MAAARERAGLLLCAVWVVALLLPGALVAQEAEEPPPSYEFLSRQAELFFNYGKFQDAADSLEQACATDEGKVSLDCHRRLANAAEKAGRVGRAIAAWEVAAVLGDEERREADAELERLYGTYGRLAVYAPEGRALPSRPLVLKHEGFLIDPKAKETLAALVRRFGAEGIDTAEVWLPFGSYTLGGYSFEVTAGEASALVLDVEDVPYQNEALAADRAGFVALGGPRELTVAFVGAGGAAPGGLVGVGPLRLGGRISLGGHLGPMRLEARVRVSGSEARSPSAPEDATRRPQDLEVLAILDAGVHVRLGGGAWITPHLGLVAGRLGRTVVGCEATQRATGHAWSGECGLVAAGVGGLLGVDLLVLPAGDPRRVGLRIGLFGEALGAGFLTGEGTGLAGLGTDLASASTLRFARIQGGADVGVAVRF